MTMSEPMTKSAETPWENARTSGRLRHGDREPPVRYRQLRGSSRRRRQCRRQPATILGRGPTWHPRPACLLPRPKAVAFGVAPGYHPRAGSGAAGQRGHLGWRDGAAVQASASCAWRCTSPPTRCHRADSPAVIAVDSSRGPAAQGGTLAYAARSRVPDHRCGLPASHPGTAGGGLSHRHGSRLRRNAEKTAGGRCCDASISFRCCPARNARCPKARQRLMRQRFSYYADDLVV